MTERQVTKELERQAVLFEDKCRSGLVADGHMRFADYADVWMNINEATLAPSTFIRYDSLLARINAAIGHLKLADMRSMHLQELYKNLAEPGLNKRAGGGLSSKTVMHHHRLISVILSEGYTPRDVSSLATPPKVQQKESCLSGREGRATPCGSPHRCAYQVADGSSSPIHRHTARESGRAGMFRH